MRYETWFYDNNDEDINVSVDADTVDEAVEKARTKFHQNNDVDLAFWNLDVYETDPDGFLTDLVWTGPADA